MNNLKHISLLTSLATVLCVPSLSAVIIFSSLDKGNTNVGFQNSSAYIGGQFELDAPGATITSATIDIRSNFGFAGTMVFGFWEVDPAADGEFFTTDDTLGTLLGTHSTGNITLTENSLLKVDGFNIEVPKNFAVTVDNSVGLFSYTIRSYFGGVTEATGGIVSGAASWRESSGTPATGAVASYTSGTPVFEFEGTVIPEPSHFAILAGLLVIAITNFRRRRERIL